MHISHKIMILLAHISLNYDFTCTHYTKLWFYSHTFHKNYGLTCTHLQRNTFISPSRILFPRLLYPDDWQDLFGKRVVLCGTKSGLKDGSVLCVPNMQLSYKELAKEIECDTSFNLIDAEVCWTINAQYNALINK